MSRPVVYLAGLISTTVPDSLRWREDAIPILTDAGFEVLSPMRGKDPKRLQAGGLTDPCLTAKDIIARDYQDVSRSNVVLAHLELFGGQRPLLGTIAELAWCWQLKIPVVGMVSRENDYILNHPFTKEFVAHFFHDEDEAVEFIIDYYSRR
jgi:nucleoside 2-deoxyribosyltransferase